MVSRYENTHTPCLEHRTYPGVHQPTQPAQGTGRGAHHRGSLVHERAVHGFVFLAGP